MSKGIYIRTEKHRKILSDVALKMNRVPPSRLGVPNTESQKELISKRLTGYKRSTENRLNMAKSRKGPLSHLWKGGIYKENLAIRNTIEYRLWREAVFARDNFTCQHCQVRGGKLNADHIKAFSKYPELRFAIDNGQTLCVDCHRKTGNYGYKANLE